MKKMKNLRKNNPILYHIALFAIISPLTYLVIVFIVKEFNPIEWNKIVRCIYMNIILALLTISIMNINEKYNGYMAIIFFTLFMYIISYFSNSFMLLNLDIMSWDWEYRLSFLLFPIAYFFAKSLAYGIIDLFNLK